MAPQKNKLRYLAIKMATYLSLLGCLLVNARLWSFLNKEHKYYDKKQQ